MTPLPRPRRIQNDRIFHLEEDRLVEPDEKGTWIRVREAPTKEDAKALSEYAAQYGDKLVLQLGAQVPLSALEHASGAVVVTLVGGRTSFDGLGALPASVRRLTIGKQPKAVPLGALAKHGLEELELDAPSVTADSPELSSLRRLGWTRAKDEALSFIARQRSLVELGLHTSFVTRLPDAPSVEHLLLFYPSKLTSLAGIERMQKLSFLRIDEPQGMVRLGDLSKLRALRSIMLMRAHTIASLHDLATVPELETLNVIHTKLDAKPFMNLRGKVKRARFNLVSLKESRAAMEHLGAKPTERLEDYERELFDF